MSMQRDQPSDSELRASDTDREQALARLQHACTTGQLTLEEFTERSERAMTARTQGELSSLLRDLQQTPVASAQAAPAPVSQVETTSQMRAILGSTNRAGRWRAAGRIEVVSVLGNCVVDLRQAEISGREVLLDVRVWLGSVEIIVPKGVQVDMGDVAVIAGSVDERLPHAPLPGAPLVRVRGSCYLGSVKATNGPWAQLEAWSNRLLGRDQDQR